MKEQAKEFEEFGKHMALEVREFYQEECNKQQGEKIFKCECKEKIEEQKHLIESLQSRIEELERKFQDVNRLQINQAGPDAKKTTFKGINRGITTDLKGFDYQNSKIFSSKPTKEVKDFSNQDQKILKLQGPPPTYTISINEIIKRYLQRLQKEEKKISESLETSFSNPLINKYPPNKPFVSISQVMRDSQENRENSNIKKKIAKNKKKKNKKIKVIKEIKEPKDIKKTNEITQKLHSQIQRIIGENSSKEIRLKHLSKLRKSFTIDNFIQYNKTAYFHSLEKDVKKLLNTLIKERLLQEFNQENLILSQDLKEYTNRGIIPKLAPEYDNYTQYEKCTNLNGLKKSLKKRVRMLIKLEKNQSV